MSASEFSLAGVSSPASTGSKYYTGGAGARAPFNGLSHERRYKPDIPAMSGTHPRTSSAADSSEATRFGYDFQRFVPGSSPEPTLGIVRDARSTPTSPRFQWDTSPRLWIYTSPSSTQYSRSSAKHLLFANHHTGSSFLPWQQLVQATVASRALRRGICFRVSSVVILHHRLHLVPLEEDPSSPGGDDGELRSDFDIAFVQAAMLNCFCMFYSGKWRLMRQAASERSYLVEAGESLLLFRPPHPHLDASASADSTASLDLWHRAQARTRAGVTIWVCAIPDSYLSSISPRTPSFSFPTTRDAWSALLFILSSIHHTCRSFSTP